jgi:hypothetical protein
VHVIKRGDYTKIYVEFYITNYIAKVYINMVSVDIFVAQSLQEKLSWPTKLKSRRCCWCTMADDFGSLRGACQNLFFSRF